MSLSLQPPAERQRLSRRDWILVGVCLLAAAASVAVVARYFDAAFPQASIDFRYDRNSSKEIAERLAGVLAFDVSGKKHAARFDSDDLARIFLERSLELERANRIMGSDVLVWYWRHRWFEPLVEEELSVDVAPTGQIVGFVRRLPEDAPAPGFPQPAADPRAVALAFLQMAGADVSDLRLVEESQRRLPKRMQQIFVFESRSVRPADAPYRHTVTLDGTAVTAYRQQLKVPDSWLRSYRDLRSKNYAAGSVDMIFLGVTMIGALVVFIVRLRRGDLALRFVLGTGVAALILVGGVALNSIPGQLSYYDTTTSYPAFVGQVAIQSVMQSLGTAMLLIVVVGAGEVLYRQRLPNQLAMPRIWSSRALTSRRVFRSLVLGYALVPIFMAYQVSFYLTARRFGAWAPTEIPYDDIVNTALPWVAVLFAGFFPAFSEEFLSRAFSIPFFQRIVRSRVTAIVIAGMIWGFGHATYPNQPFWIRGVEVGLAGIAAGFFMDRFGLLPLLVWHYTIDAVYTATLLFASGNTYYIVSAAAASLIFIFPLMAAVTLYIRNRGFVPDDDLTNAALPLAPTPERLHPDEAEAPLPEARPPGRRRIAAALALAALASAAWLFRPPAPADAVDYRLSREDARRVARAHVAALHGGRGWSEETRPGLRVIATPVEGFRSWNDASAREDGGAPGSPDETAAGFLLRSGLTARDLVTLMREKIEMGTWSVRFFAPSEKDEIFVEVDGRTPQVVGYHRLQEEERPGAALAREQALLLASRAFATYGVDPRDFTVEEALSFQKPKRRDWLFHFQERTPIVDRAFRRVTVRVSGGEVTQFHKTIHVPESVYREAETETLLNVVMLVLKIAGIVLLLAGAITGLVIVTRQRGLPWRRPLRWAAVLTLVPVLGFFARRESMLFGYSTSVAWETYLVSLFTSFATEVGLQAGMVFLALAGLQAAFPWAFDVTGLSARRRFGRDAVLAVIATVSALVLFDVALRFGASLFPTSATVSLSVPAQAGTPLPALLEAARAIVAAIVVSGVVALYLVAVRARRATLTVAAIFCLALDPAATPAEMPRMLAEAAALAAVAWLVARRLLNRNPLAWPLATFSTIALAGAAGMLGNSRPDLIANGLALVILVLAVLVWAAYPDPRQPLSRAGSARI